MDSLTHIVLGACIGEAVAGKYIGRRALFLGALAQSIPDIDVITALWQTELQYVVSHRAFTHSILFAVLAIILCTKLAEVIFRRSKVPLKIWILLFGINVFTHIFLDSFNSYGTAWFEPFSHQRFSFHTLFVADPLFSIGPLLASIVLSFLRRSNEKKKMVWQIGIGLSCLYLCYAVVNKITIDRKVQAVVQSTSMQKADYFTTPSPFNSLLWFVAIQKDSGFYIGYHSVFDESKQMQLSYFPKNEYLLASVNNKGEVRDLKKFENKFYTVELWSDTVVFNVLRFGQIVGWHDPNEKFVFHYFLDKPGANRLVTQRGRVKRSNQITFRSLLRRIRGD